MICPKCYEEMVIDVPISKYLGDVVSVVGRAFLSGAFHHGNVSETSVAKKTTSSIKDYWTNDTYFKYKSCGYKLYEQES